MKPFTAGCSTCCPDRLHEQEGAGSAEAEAVAEVAAGL